MIRWIMPTAAHRLVLSLTVACVFAAPASAAEVARTDGASLDARDSPQTGFCLRITERDSESGGGSGTCGRAPWRPRRSNLATWVTGERVLAGGAVPASVTRAEAELVDGRRISFETVAGPRYRGRHAGKLRFFLAALPVADPGDDEAGGLVLLRFFGADGTLAGVAASDRDGARIGRSQLLLRERARGRSITVTSETQRRVAPNPIALDRTEVLACLLVRERSGFGSSGSSSICHEAGPNRPDLLAFPQAGCDGVRTVIAGFVGDRVTAVRLGLGSGRIRQVSTRTLRDNAGGEHRYVATRVPRGEAVRSMSTVGAEASYELGEPPSGLPCLDQSGFYALSYFAPQEAPGAPRPQAGDEQAVADGGRHRLLARDAESERLCVDLDALVADGSDCALPPVNGEDAFGFGRAGIVWAVLPEEVAGVRLPDGREVATVEGRYRGRYTGAVRFLFAEADASGDARFRLLDAGGGVIGTLPVLAVEADPLEPIAGPVTLASGRGWRLTAARHRHGRCVNLALGSGEPECVAGFAPGQDGAVAAVGCAPRVAVLTGTLSRRAPRPRVFLRGGRNLRPRIVRIPRRVGGGRAWVLALPRRARVRGLRLNGRRSPFTLLPAARQCGYRVYAPGFGQAVPEFELR